MSSLQTITDEPRPLGEPEQLPLSPTGEEPQSDQPDTTGGETPPAPATPAWDSPENPYLAKAKEHEETLAELKARLEQIEPKYAEDARKAKEAEDQAFKELLSTSGLTTEEATDISYHYGLGKAMLRSTDRLNEVAKRDAALGLARKHVAPTAPASELFAFVDGLMECEDQAVMERMAGVLARERRGNFQQERIGAERIEGGGTGGLMTMTDQEWINRWGAGDIPATRENAEKARRLSDGGLLARSR